MGLGPEPFPLCQRIACDPPRLCVGFLEHKRRFAARLVLQFVRGLLGAGQRRTQERLELPVTLQIGLELLDPVRVVRPLAPYGLERVCDLLDRAIDGVRWYPNRPRLNRTCLNSTGV